MANRNSKEIEAAKRAVKNNPKAVIIAVVAIILIIAIAFCVLYFGFPKTWNSLMSSIRGDGDDSDGLALGEGELKVHFINIGQGECIYIQFPDSTDMIIDCGQKGSGFQYSQPKEYIDKINPDGIINHLMLTHSDQDHVEYMDEIINDFEIKNIYMPKILAAPTNQSLQNQISELPQEKMNLFSDPEIDKVTTATYARFFIAALSEENCKIIFNEDIDDSHTSIVIKDDTYRLTFYCPTTEFYNDRNISSSGKWLNAVSPIGILEYNQRKVVFTGDSNENNEPNFVNRINKIDCDVLKVAHHGSASSSSDAFLNSVTCEYAVISCGTDNEYGHPTQSALDRFAARNMTVYRTDKNGTVVLTIDGDGKMTFSVETEVSQEVIFIGADSTNAKISAIPVLPLFANLFL